MSLSDSGAIIISAPFGEPFQRVQTNKYHWNNEHRGSDTFVIIQFTLAGRGQFMWEGRSWEVPEGHAFLAITPEQSSYGYPSDAAEPWEFAWLNLYGSLGIRLVRELRAAYGPVPALPAGSTAGREFLGLITKARERPVADPFDMSQACYSFLVEWARQLSGTSTDRDPVEAAERICQTRFREPLGVKELAWETGLSREHFTRLFTERHGISPARYLRAIRAEEARRMLAGPGTPLKEAALRCGFPSVRALNHALADLQSSVRPRRDSGLQQAKGRRPRAS